MFLLVMMILAITIERTGGPIWTGDTHTISPELINDDDSAFSYATAYFWYMYGATGTVTENRGNAYGM